MTAKQQTVTISVALTVLGMLLGLFGAVIAHAVMTEHRFTELETKIMQCVPK